MKSENSEALNSTELGQYIQSTKENAEMALELLIKYLCECSDLYPLWHPKNDCGCAKYFKVEEGSNELSRQFHIYFPNKRKKGCDCK